MRDLLFKNLTSIDKKRKVVVSSETMDREGIHSVIQRHFACIVKEVKDGKMQRLPHYLNVIKERDNKEHREKFFCKIKGNIFAISEGKIFEILFMHSLRITLSPTEAKTGTC
jgi:hypothetical protein